VTVAGRSARRQPGLGFDHGLLAEWQRRDAAHVAAIAQPPAKRDATAEAANLAAAKAIDQRLAEIDQRLKARFPEYAALARLELVALGAVQAALSPDKAHPASWAQFIVVGEGGTGR
jgi:hypothetical protein